MPYFYKSWPKLSSIGLSSRGQYVPVDLNLEPSGSQQGSGNVIPKWTRLARPPRPRLWLFGLMIAAVFLLFYYAPTIHNLRDQLLEAASATSTPTNSQKLPAEVPPPTDHRPSAKPNPEPALSSLDSVDWSRFAYVQYVTDLDYLCNSVMIFETLDRLGSRADRLMMYPKTFFAAGENMSKEARLLKKARDEYSVELRAIDILHREVEDGDSTWADSYTKLLAFNQTEYDRVLSLDSDSTILQDMDELFLLPSTTVAMPRAYWGTSNSRQLSSQLLLVEPSAKEFARVFRAIQNAKGVVYDMEIVNRLYGASCMVLPHRRYDLLTGEFRNRDHAKYLGSKTETWNPKKALEEAKYLHFSDWPVPKPWIKTDEEVYKENQPACKKDQTGQELDCTDRDLWWGFYDDFSKRRERVCGTD